MYDGYRISVREVQKEFWRNRQKTNCSQSHWPNGIEGKKPCRTITAGNTEKGRGVSVSHGETLLLSSSFFINFWFF